MYLGLGLGLGEWHCLEILSAASARTVVFMMYAFMHDEV